MAEQETRMSRFTKLPDGGVHDATLNLEWHAQSFECDTWQAAMDKAAALGDGWRAPTVDELASLCDRTRWQPACDPIFEMPYSDWHWSSSPVVGWPVLAWSVDFSSGNVYDNYRDNSGFVRPVRAARGNPNG